MQIWSCVERKLYHEGRQSKTHGSVSWVQKLLHHQLLERLRTARLFASLMSLRWEICKMLRSKLSLVSLVAVDLCQVPGRVRRGESQCVLLLWKKKQFSVGSPSANRPLFEAALEKSFEKWGARKSGRDCRLPQFSRGDINNNLFV